MTVSHSIDLSPSKNVFVHSDLWFLCISAGGFRSPRQAADRLGFPPCVNTAVKNGKRVNPKYARLVAEAGGLDADALIYKTDIGYTVLAPCVGLVERVKEMHRRNLVTVYDLRKGSELDPGASAFSTGDAEKVIRRLAQESFDHLTETDIVQAVRRLQFLGVVYRIKNSRLVFNSLDTKRDANYLAELEKQGLELIDDLMRSSPSARFPLVEASMQVTMAYSRNLWAQKRYLEAANRALNAVFEIAVGDAMSESRLQPFYGMPNRALLAKVSRVGELVAAQSVQTALEEFYLKLIDTDLQSVRLAYSAIFDALFGNHNWRENVRR